MEFRRVAKMPSARPGNIYLPCPCLSGEKFKWCCRSGVKEVVRAPPGEPTKFSHPNCYAGPLSDCSLDISKEHILTHSILKRLTVGKTVNVANPVFGSADPKALTPQALGAHVLCARHNNALPRLDEVGHAFFLRLEQLFRLGIGEKPAAARALFNGFDLERWFLKTTAAQVASGWGGERTEVPRDWLDIIWSNARFGRDDGLHQIVRTESAASVRVRFSPVTDGDDPTFVGGGFELFGFQFFIVRTSGKRWDPRFEAMHRPTAIISEIGAQQFPTDIDFGPGVPSQALLIEMDGRREAGRVPDAWE